MTKQEYTDLLSEEVFGVPNNIMRPLVLLRIRMTDP